MIDNSAHRLPPFAGIRAFEAAARRGSFSLAAEELFVTQSAVSHQVKALEDFLGVRLLDRARSGVTLTDAGAIFVADVRHALERLAAGTARVLARREETLTISLLPTFATRWLIPRLGGFHGRHPEIEVRLDTSIEPVDFSRSDVDLAIRYGRGQWKGLSCDALQSEDLFPVCSPDLRVGNRRLREPAELASCTLLHNQSHPGEWRIWLSAAECSHIDSEKGPRFASSDLALRAATAGLGVALGRRPLVDEELASGRLVAPFDLRLTSGSRYYLVYPPAYAARAKVAVFREWLLAEVGPTG